jgi:hypothetical protein
MMTPSLKGMKTQKISLTPGYRDKASDIMSSAAVLPAIQMRCSRQKHYACKRMHAFGIEAWVMPAAPLPPAVSPDEDPPDELAADTTRAAR